MRCKIGDGYLIYQPEFMETPARLKCMACGWMLSDPNFSKEKPRYFPPDSVDRRIEWRQKNPGYDLYEAKSAACQLGVSVSYLKDCIRRDSSAPVLMEWGLIACDTSVLQEWWDAKRHHGVKPKAL
jgi:hypothetical protein